MTRLDLRLPERLLAAIDADRAKTGEERSAWVRRVLARAARASVDRVRRGRPPKAR